MLNDFSYNVKKCPNLLQTPAGQTLCESCGSERSRFRATTILFKPENILFDGNRALLYKKLDS